MKILFDTNVLISAFLTCGISYDVIEDAIHEHDLYYTDFIIDEFKKIFRNNFHFSKSVINEFTKFISNYFKKADTSNIIDRVCRNPDDDQILADAVLKKIDVIISGGKDLLDIKFYKGIKIISPKRYWDLYQ